MVASTEVLDTLKSIGLNLYERKIFVALLAKGVATAAEVSEIASVPRSRSYDVLQSLADKGFILVQPSKPIKYVAQDPAEALNHTKEILKKKHEEMIERINKLNGSSVLDELENIHKNGLNLVHPTELIGTLKGKDIINRQLRSVFRDAKNKINILTSEQGLNELYSNHFRILKKIAKRGVKLKIVAPLSEGSAASALSKIAELKNIKSNLGRFCIIDNKNFVFSLTDDKEVHESQDIAFWADSQCAVNSILQPYFDRLWSSSKK